MIFFFESGRGYVFVFMLMCALVVEGQRDQ